VGRDGRGKTRVAAVSFLGVAAQTGYNNY